MQRWRVCTKRLQSIEIMIKQNVWSTLGFLIAALLLVSGCAATPTVVVTPVRQAVVATSFRVVVTSTPRPTATLPPTPTLPYDIGQVEGRWQADFNYRLRGYPIFNDIRYSGSFEINIASDGAVTGAGSLYTTLDQPPCNAQVREGARLDATLEGQLASRGNKGEVVGQITLKPKDAAARQAFELICANGVQSQKADIAILWPMLAVADGLRFQAVFTPGVAVSGIRNLTGASGGMLYGTLATEIRLSR